jgi:hypothetical protein
LLFPFPSEKLVLFSYNSSQSFNSSCLITNIGSVVIIINTIKQSGLLKMKRNSSSNSSSNWWLWWWTLVLTTTLISLNGGSGGVLALNVAVDVNNTCNIPKTAAVKFSDKSFVYTKDPKTFENYCNAVNMQLASPEDIEGALCILNQVPKNYRTHTKVFIRFNDEIAILEPYTEDPLKQIRVPLFSHHGGHHHGHHLPARPSSHILCVKDVRTSLPLKRRRGEEENTTTTTTTPSVTRDSKESRQLLMRNRSDASLIKRLFNIVIKQQHRRGESIQFKRDLLRQRHVVKSTSARDSGEGNSTATTTTPYKNKLKATLEARKMAAAMAPQNRRPPLNSSTTTDGPVTATKPHRGFFASLFGPSPKRTDGRTGRRRSMNRAANDSSLSLTDGRVTAENATVGEPPVTTTLDQTHTAELRQNLDTLKATLYQELGLEYTTTPTEKSPASNEKSEEDHDTESGATSPSSSDRRPASLSDCTMNLARDDDDGDEKCIMAEALDNVIEDSNFSSADAAAAIHSTMKKEDKDLMKVLDEMSRLIRWMIDEEQRKGSSSQVNPITTNQTESRLMKNVSDVSMESITNDNSSIARISSNTTMENDRSIFGEDDERKEVYQENQEVDEDEEEDEGEGEENHEEEAENGGDDDDKKDDGDDGDDEDGEEDDDGIVVDPSSGSGNGTSKINDPPNSLNNVTAEIVTSNLPTVVLSDLRVQQEGGDIGNETQRVLISRRGMTSAASGDNAMRRILDKKLQQMSSARKQLQSIHGIYNNNN